MEEDGSDALLQRQVEERDFSMVTGLKGVDRGAREKKNHSASSSNKIHIIIRVKNGKKYTYGSAEPVVIKVIPISIRDRSSRACCS